MERKIGEIFTVKGRQVQVVEQANACDCVGCCFECNGICFTDDEAGECDSANRTDRKEVIFKVLSCEDAYTYDELKQMFLNLLAEKAYTNVQIIK